MIAVHYGYSAPLVSQSIPKLGVGIMKWLAIAAAPSLTPIGKPKPAATCSPHCLAQHRSNRALRPYHSLALNQWSSIQKVVKKSAAMMSAVCLRSNAAGPDKPGPFMATTSASSIPTYAHTKVIILPAMAVIVITMATIGSPVELMMSLMFLATAWAPPRSKVHW